MPDHGPWNANTVQNTSLFLFQINEVMLLTYKMKPNVIKKKLIGQNMLCKWGLMNYDICDFAVTSSKLCDRKKTQWDFEIRDQIFSGPVYTRQASPVSPAGPLYQADLAHALFPHEILFVYIKRQAGPAEIPVTSTEISTKEPACLLI